MPSSRPLERTLRLSTHRLSWAVALALGLSPTLAAAQSADTRHRDAEELDRVIVTATPLRRTAEELSQPVAVLSGEALDTARGSSLGDTVDRLPGVQSSYFGPGVGRPIVRGLDGARVQVLSGGLGAGDVSTLSVDHAVSIEPFLADQIEVLKGPATLLYGSGAIGGAVNVVDGRVPERITDGPFQGRAEVRYDGVNDGRTAMFRADATSSSGNFVFHVDGLHRDTDDYDIPGYAEDTHSAHEGEEHEEEEGVRGTLPNSAVRTRAGAFGMSWIGERGMLGASASLFDTRYGVPGHAHGHSEEEGGEEEGEETVTIRMDQRRTEVRGGLDGLGAFDTLRVKFANTDYTHTEFEGSEIGTVFRNDTVEARAELTHRDWAGWNGAFGLQGAQRDFAALGDEAFVPGSDARDLGMFWIGEREFGAVRLDLGARYDRNRIEPDIGRTRDFDTSSFSAAVRWDVSDALHLNVGLDRAQRAPAAEELYSEGLHVATSSFEFGDADLDVETANRAEVGLHWHTDNLRIGASLYYVDFDDYIYLADTGVEDEDTPARVWTQGDARFTGGEIELDWTFLSNASGEWTLHAFGDMVRGRLTGSGVRTVAFSIEHEDGDVEDFTADIARSGDLPRLAPGRFGAELRWSNAHWRAGIGAVRYLRQDRTGAFEEETAGYTLVDADLAWHLDTASGNAWEVFVKGDNLLDEEARPHTSFLKELAPLPGRNIGVGVRLFF